MTPRQVSLLLVVAGAVVVVVGVGLWSLPAGLVVAGVSLILIGLLLIDVTPRGR